MPKRPRSTSTGSYGRRVRPRRPYRKYRRVWKRRRTSTYKPVSGFNQGVQTVKLRYADADTPTLTLIASNSSGALYNKYNVNSAYDANAGFGTAAIPGFAEYAAAFQNYRVTWASIKCTFSSSSGNPPLYCGIVFLPIAGVLPANFRSWIELQGNPYLRKMKLLSNGTGSESSCTLYVKCPLGKLIGQPSMLYSDVGYSALTTGNPLFILNGYVWIMTADGNASSTNWTVFVNVEITMFVQFWNRKTLYS